VTLERLEWYPAGVAAPPNARYGGPYPRTFDPLGGGIREYGNRVGVFRVMEALDRHGIAATVPIDSALAVENPFLVDECMRREWELIGHGVVSSRMITDDLSEEEERVYLRASLEPLAEATGSFPRGWLGPDYVESSRTVRLLAEMGLDYVCDWANDEQPYLMPVGSRRIVSVPASADADDVLTHRFRGIPIDRWARLVCDTFDGLYVDGLANGRLLLINLHPYLVGQPFRIPHLAAVIEHLVRHDDVWFATGSEIVDWYMARYAIDERQPPEAQARTRRAGRPT
jgi:peptidoglycan/xylan/chitin deacetylase (PgdA/CDA1 family)